MVTLRPATPDDAALLAELGARTFRDAYAAQMDIADIEAFITDHFSATIQDAELRDPASRIVFAELDGAAVGYVDARTGVAPDSVGGHRPVLLSRLYVDVSAQGAGVGRALFAWFLEEARRLDGDVLWLTVWERNERAIAVYRRWGFEVVGDVEFQAGADTQRDLVMARPVG